MRFRISPILLGLLIPAALVSITLAPPPAQARPSYFTSRCATCHTNDTPTCDGCHQHESPISATADLSQYNPGDPVTITLHGGQEGGWIRALLYDQTGTEIDRKSGPTGTGDDGLGNPVTFPVALHGIAPSEAGNYTWQAAWFGNINNGGSTHSELRTNVVIHVVQDPSSVPTPGFLAGTWGKVKDLFR